MPAFAPDAPAAPLCRWPSEAELAQIAATLAGEMLQEALWSTPLQLALAFAVRARRPGSI